MVNETSTTGLLKTKYTLPRLNKHLIPRQNLNYRLNDFLKYKVTLITAPAGYGKTTAVLKWLETLTLLPSAWLSLDAQDNDVIVFWRYFCAALGNISSNISKDVDYVFTSQELLKAKVHLSIMVDRLTNISSDSLLILDDFHFIDHQTVLDDLSYLITYLPVKVHLLLISRTAPQLRLTRLGLKENLLRIQAKDLRFSSVEINQYYQTRGYFLQEKEIQKLESYTEGWAAALVAVTLSLKDQKDRQRVFSNFGNCNKRIETYLAEDVFNTWTSEQQNFMIKTSILDRLCGPLCEEITDYDGNRLLRELFDQNSFLIALDDEGIWFRYHHLFLDFLRKKLDKLEAVLVQKLHRRAGEWLKINGLVNEAIEHFLRGADYENAQLLIEKHGGALVRRGEYAQILSWIERLPPKISGNSPIIMLIKATYFTSINDLQSAWECLEQIEPVIKNRTALSQNFHAEYMMVKTNLFVMQGDIENALPAIIEAAACGINNVRNTNYLDCNLNDISIYRTVYQILIKILRKSPTQYDLLVENYRSLISLNPGYAPLVAGEFYYESGRLNEALPKLLTSIDEAIHADCPGALVPAMVTLSKIRRAHGDLTGALEVIEECEHRVQKFHKPHWSYMLKAFKVRLYIDLKDYEKLDKWMTESRLSLSLYQDITRTQEYELIIMARVLIVKKRYGDARLLLHRLLNFADRLKRTHSVVEITNLLAIAALKSSDKTLAKEHFKKALSIGIEEGFSRSFVDELGPMVLLLELYIEQHNEEDRLLSFAHELLNQTKDAVKHSTSFVSPNTYLNLLTPTEQKVFDYILNAYENAEIAAELGITIRTVKAHTSSIYRKLGVKNRLQCFNNFRK